MPKLQQTHITALILAAVCAILFWGSASAASVTVTTTSDVVDGDTSSIAGLIATPGVDGVISLREAILAAENTPGADTINFNIPGCGGACTITPSNGNLPALASGSTTISVFWERIWFS